MLPSAVKKMLKLQGVGEKELKSACSVPLIGNVNAALAVQVANVQVRQRDRLGFCQSYLCIWCARGSTTPPPPTSRSLSLRFLSSSFMISTLVRNAFCWECID